MDFKSIIREEDGFIFATALCQISGKRLHDWKRTAETQSLIKKLEDKLKIKVIEVKKGGNKYSQGSWIHPLLAIHLAQWISSDFCIKVSNWIEEWKSIKEKNKIEYNDSILNIIPDNIYNQREKEIQLKLQKNLGGNIEVETEFGYIDLLTDIEIIEIKIGQNWKHGLGQLCVYSEVYKEHKKRLHLFDIEYNEKINIICSKYNIVVSYE
jgi:hypothetical protein